eukprot:7124362-Pyramimonas_sp.AAC.1
MDPHRPERGLGGTRVHPEDAAAGVPNIPDQVVRISTASDRHRCMTWHDDETGALQKHQMEEEDIGISVGSIRRKKGEE